MNGDLKQTFIINALQQYNQRVKLQMQQTMRKLGVGHTDAGYNSIAYNAAAQGNGAVSQLSFMEYLRFIDMGVGKSHPLGGLKTMKATLLSQNKSGVIQSKDNIRKAKKIYAKVAYGNIGWLMSKVSYGYTDEAIELLKKELQYQNTTN